MPVFVTGGVSRLDELLLYSTTYTLANYRHTDTIVNNKIVWRTCTTGVPSKAVGNNILYGSGDMYIYL